MTRRITFLIYPDFQLLDATGPVAAFEIAGRLRPGFYTLQIAAARPGLVSSSAGVSLPAAPYGRSGPIDTLIVAGGYGSRAAARCARTRRFVRARAADARRLCSVCSGSFVLAAAGLLDGRRATTHWSCAAEFERTFPQVRVDADRIFIRAGNIWTSAGITAGIDLALALITEDLGEEIARRTAQQLVVYYRRPGGQSQFSALLQMQHGDGRFTALLDHIRSNLQHRLTVADLAGISCMSPRHFSRAFHAELGYAPAKAVERLRVDAARAALEGGRQSVKRVALACGFGSAERMRRSFLRVVGSPPSALKFS